MVGRGAGVLGRTGLILGRLLKTSRKKVYAAGVRRQLGSSTSWLIVGLFAVLSGVAFVMTLNAFLDTSTQALTAPPPQPINVNQLLSASGS